MRQMMLVMVKMTVFNKRILFQLTAKLLLRMEGFLTEFITPIVKVTKGNKEKVFFTVPEYQIWKDETDGGKGWKIKYYKGLGTSTSKEAQAYFSDLDRHQIVFEAADEIDESALAMAFCKKGADARKIWLEGCTPDTYLDQDVESIK